MIITRKRVWFIAREVVVIGLVVAFGFTASKVVNSWLGQRAFDLVNLEDVPFETALLRSQQEQKPVILEFSADWCSSCRKLDKTVLAESQVNEKIRSEYIFSRLDYDLPEERQIFDQFGVKGFPLIIIIKPGATEPQILATTFDPEQFLRQL